MGQITIHAPLRKTMALAPKRRVPIVVRAVSEMAWSPARYLRRVVLGALAVFAVLLTGIAWLVFAPQQPVAASTPQPSGPAVLGATFKAQRLVEVDGLTYCSSIPEGVDEYERWLKNPEPRALAGLVRQYGGELVSPGQQMVVQEAGPVITQLRTLTSKTICYLPTRDLR